MSTPQGHTSSAGSNNIGLTHSRSDRGHVLNSSVKRALFVLHADTERDASFVRSYLLPELGLATHDVLLSSELPLGMSVVQALESGVTSSRVTVVVVTTALLREAWPAFGEELAAHHAAHGGLLVPLLLSECSIPLRLDFRVRMDCRQPARRSAEIARLRELLDLPLPVEPEVPCPYPGMQPFTAENAALFCGRTRAIDDLVSRISGGLRELYVIGPSGCGKSSLLQSGVAPCLQRRDDAIVREPFEVHVLRPGANPGQRLAAEFRRVTLKTRVLVLIDQLEEIFTLADRTGRLEFFEKLDELRAVPKCHLCLVLRADFQGALMQSELWPHVQRSYRYEVEPLRGNALREAILAPAMRVGVEFEPMLVDRLLSDAASEPGALPLIQETLVHLWRSRERNLMTMAQYTELGNGAVSGFAVALSRRADAALTSLDAVDQAIARRLFLRLVSFGEGRDDTRRQQPVFALRSGEDTERFKNTLNHLIDARLITASDDPTVGVAIDLAHETLIAAWPELQSWIRRYRDTEAQRRHLELDAAQWAQRSRQGRHDGGLLDECQLSELDEWYTDDLQNNIGVSDEIKMFIAASRASVATRLAENSRFVTGTTVDTANGLSAGAVRKRVWTRIAAVLLLIAALVVVGIQAIRRDSERPPPYRRTHYEGFLAIPPVGAKRYEDVWQIGQEGDWTGAVINGAYRLCNTSVQTASYTNRLERIVDGSIADMRNGRATIRVGVEPPNTTHSGVGLLFRCSRDTQQYLAFVLNAGHGVSLLERNGDRLSVLWSSGLSKQPADLTELRIDGRDSEIDLYVDGQLVHTAAVRIKSGDVGVMAYSTGCFVLDDLTMYEPTASLTQL